MEIYTVNLEYGLPTVDTAKNRLGAALRSAKAERRSVVKFIHGYGSSGKGGKIRTMVRRELQAKKDAGQIRFVIAGERFSPFEAECQQALHCCFSITQDSDYQRANPGITVVIL